MYSTATINLCELAVALGVSFSVMMVVVSIIVVGWKKALGKPWVIPYVSIGTLVLWIGPLLVLMDDRQLQVWVPVGLFVVLVMGGLVIVRILPKVLREWQKHYPETFKLIFGKIKFLQ